MTLQCAECSMCVCVYYVYAMIIPNSEKSFQCNCMWKSLFFFCIFRKQLNCFHFDRCYVLGSLAQRVICNFHWDLHLYYIAIHRNANSKRPFKWKCETKTAAAIKRYAMLNEKKRMKNTQSKKVVCNKFSNRK